MTNNKKEIPDLPELFQIVYKAGYISGLQSIQRTMEKANIEEVSMSREMVEEMVESALKAFSNFDTKE